MEKHPAGAMDSSGSQVRQTCVALAAASASKQAPRAKASSRPPTFEGPVPFRAHGCAHVIGHRGVADVEAQGRPVRVDQADPTARPQRARAR
jgi:hypothetical protein